MIYATIEDITTIYPKVLDTVAEWEGDTMNTNQVERSLEDAAEEIDMYLSSRYTLPLPSVPRSLRGMTVDLALYKLSIMTERRVKDMRIRYEDAVSRLKDIRSGKMGLGFENAGDRDDGTPDDDVIDTIQMGSVIRG